MDWQKNALSRLRFDALVLVIMFLIVSLAATHYKHQYEDAQKSTMSLVLEQASALDFVVKNHEALQFPSCYHELSYLGTKDPSTLYVSNGTLMGWRMGDTTPYCWNNEKGYFDCEELCQK